METKTKAIQTWVVGLFPETKEYSVLPSNWILKNDNPKITFCQWPPKTKVTSDDLRAAVDPSPSWTVYRIKIYGGNKTYESFNKAWHQKVILVESSTESESPVKFKQKSNTNNSNSSSDENDNDSGFSVMPLIGKKISKPLAIPLTYENEDKPIVTTDSSLNVSMAQNSQSNSCAVETTLNTSSTINNFYQEMNIEQRQLTPLIPTTSLHSDSLTHPYQNETIWYPPDTLQNIPSTHNAGTVYDGMYSRLDKTLSDIQKDQSCIKLLLHRVLSKIEGNVQNYNEWPLSKLEDSFLSKFPMINLKGFMLVENCIVNEPDFVPKLESFVNTIGGRSAENHLNRVMAKLFTYKYGMECTWTGRGKEITTKVGDSEIMKLIKKVIQKACTTSIFTDSQFEKVVKEWFRGASQKHNRETNRNKII